MLQVLELWKFHRLFIGTIKKSASTTMNNAVDTKHLRCNSRHKHYWFTFWFSPNSCFSIYSIFTNQRDNIHCRSIFNIGHFNGWLHGSLAIRSENCLHIGLCPLYCIQNCDFINILTKDLYIS